MKPTEQADRQLLAALYDPIGKRRIGKKRLMERQNDAK
jgi:hypothetical protein